MDIHSGQIQGFFDVKRGNHLYAAPIARQYFTKKFKNLIINLAKALKTFRYKRGFAKKFGDLDLDCDFTVVKTK